MRDLPIFYFDFLKKIRYTNIMQHSGWRYLTKNLSIAIGIVLIWRGVWVMLDLLDSVLFGGNHIATAVGGVIIGIVILYLPERNLDALERL